MAQSKTKTCQNCKTKFIIEPEDFEFYKKIDVPEPTFCPECRMQRRMAYWNDLKVYMRKDDFSGRKIFSEFSPETPFKIYDQKIWESDKWDPMEYARDYDFNKPFFEQFKELLLDVPFPSRVVVNVVNCDYCKNISDVKNGYLLISGVGAENSAYCFRIYSSRDSYDCTYLYNSELCYGSFMLTNCYKTIYSSHCEDSQNLFLCYNCINCQDCFGCTNLRHKKYHIFNKQYTEEEYFKKIKEFDSGSNNSIFAYRKKTDDHHLKFPRKYMFGKHNVNVLGDYIYNSKNIINCYSVKEGEDLKYCQFLDTKGARDIYDQTGFGLDAQKVYECSGIGKGANNIKHSWHCLIGCYDLDYCVESRSISNCFGCAGLRHKEYCIFNKQYTKEEYEKLVPRIKEHMNKMPYVDKKGRTYKYGEFLPIELSPFAYNETIAQEYYPLTKEQALAQGYNWHDKPKAEYEPTIKAKDLPDHIKDVDNKILKEIIECQNVGSGCASSGVFRLIPQELRFYQKQNISLPRLCPDCRHRERIKQRNPMKLYKRQCMCAGEKSNKSKADNIYQNTADHPRHKNKHCPNTFQTTYAPNRKEIVYCESCYNKEVS